MCIRIMAKLLKPIAVPQKIDVMRACLSHISRNNISITSAWPGRKSSNNYREPWNREPRCTADRGGDEHITRPRIFILRNSPMVALAAPEYVVGMVHSARFSPSIRQHREEACPRESLMTVSGDSLLIIRLLRLIDLRGVPFSDVARLLKRVPATRCGQ